MSNNVLYDFAVGNINHIYQGLCPEYQYQLDSRDPECIVCQALMQYDHLEDNDDPFNLPGFKFKRGIDYSNSLLNAMEIVNWFNNKPGHRVSMAWYNNQVWLVKCDYPESVAWSTDISLPQAICRMAANYGGR